LDIGRHVLGRPFDRGNDVADAREVENVAGVREQAMAGFQRPYIDLFERQVRIGRVVGDVGFPPAHQAVDHAHGEAALQQQIDHMAADEAGAPGDDGDGADNGVGAHAACSFFMVRML
jgi:hypothetical protein